MNNQVVTKEHYGHIRPYEGGPTDLIRFTNEFSEIHSQILQPRKCQYPL